MKKKIVLFALALTLVFTSCARAQQYDSEGDFYYEIQDGKVTITKYIGTKQEVRIPPQIRRTPVTEIGREAFRRVYINSVVIPNSVAIIGDGAFKDNQLTSVIIGNNVTTIGDGTNGYGAFMNNQLTSVVIPDSVTRIEISAFDFFWNT